MLPTFFALAMTAPARQRAFRNAVVAHLVFVGGLVAFAINRPGTMTAVGPLAVVAGIVEGAIVIGWRLTQIPKSQSLEFLLVSPVQPCGLFLAEACVGFARLGLLCLAGLPLFLLLCVSGEIDVGDVVVLAAAPWLWGAVTGIAVTAWAYESRGCRRAGEVAGAGLILTYLTVGVLAGENLRLWLAWLPEEPRWWVMELFVRLHQWNPFAVAEYWFDPARHPLTAVERLAGVSAFAVMLLTTLTARAAARLKGHFHDRHYRPLDQATPADPSGIRDRPLAWWAVRRVMEYSGRSNLYLAGGFGVVYAAWLVAGDGWPGWLGRGVFEMVERFGGVPTVTTGLVLLAAVPAAFQYGLWDSSVPQRLQRLELLLLTRLRGRDYCEAAAAAAWRRGRGYLVVAVILWAAAATSGRYSWDQGLAAVAAAGVLWGAYFALGFRAFAAGRQANGLGSLLTLGLPILAYALMRGGWPGLAAWTPPGMVFTALSGSAGAWWMAAPLALGLASLWLGRSSMAACDAGLRAWYDRFHGMKMAD